MNRLAHAHLSQIDLDKFWQVFGQTGDFNLDEGMTDRTALLFDTLGSTLIKKMQGI